MRFHQESSDIAVQDTKPSPLLMSVRAAGLLAGISKTKTYAMIGDGRLRARKIDAVMRVHKDDLKAMIEALPKVGE